MKLNKHIGIYRAEWKDIEGYEGIYQVSNLGQVRSLDRYIKEKSGKVRFAKGKILRRQISKDNYKVVHLYKDGKHKCSKIHRLVAKAFIPNQNNKPCVDHIDTNIDNNRIWNLRWTTHSENNNNDLTLKHMSIGKLNMYRGENNPNSKPIYCNELEEIRLFGGQWEKELNLRSGSVSECCNGHKKMTGWFTFRFATQDEIDNYNSENINILTEEQVERIQNELKLLRGKTTGKPIYCEELNDIRPTANMWGNELGITIDNIRRCCNGKQKSAKGYHFRYATEEEINIKIYDVKLKIKSIVNR